MKLIPFEPHHFYMVEGREMNVINDADGWAIRLQYERSFYQGVDGTTGRSAYTILKDDIPICCFGAFLMFGVGAVWMRVVDNPPIYIYRHIKRELGRFIRESDIRRMESVIPLNKTVNHKFIKAMGFYIESMAKAYFVNDAGVRWAWVRNDA